MYGEQKLGQLLVPQSMQKTCSYERSFEIRCRYSFCSASRSQHGSSRSVTRRAFPWIAEDIRSYHASPPYDLHLTYKHQLDPENSAPASSSSSSSSSHLTHLLTAACKHHSHMPVQIGVMRADPCISRLFAPLHHRTPPQPRLAFQMPRPATMHLRDPTREARRERHKVCEERTYLRVLSTRVPEA
jgi:hypothetical protein